MILNFQCLIPSLHLACNRTFIVLSEWVWKVWNELPGEWVLWWQSWGWSSLSHRCGSACCCQRNWQEERQAKRLWNRPWQSFERRKPKLIPQTGELIFYIFCLSFELPTYYYTRLTTLTFSLCYLPISVCWVLFLSVSILTVRLILHLTSPHANLTVPFLRKHNWRWQLL